MTPYSSVRRLSKEETGLVGELFRAVYGKEYPADYVYHPEKLWAENEKGNTYSVLAFNEKKEAVGHIAIYRSAPNPRIYEIGQALVLPQYRGNGVFDDLIGYVHEILVREADVDALFSESVCNHLFSQKSVAKRSYIDTALELDLMPAKAYGQEKSNRVSCLFQFREEKSKSQMVYLPPCYHSQLAFFYQDLFPRELREAVFFLPQEGETLAQEKIYNFAGVARIAVKTIGANFSSYVLALEKLAQEKGIQAMQVYLPLNQPAVGSAVSILRKNGFFLGGVLPCWFGGDGLLMQKLWDTVPLFTEINLYNAKAKKILDLIWADWERSRG